MFYVMYYYVFVAPLYHGSVIYYPATQAPFFPLPALAPTQRQSAMLLSVTAHLLYFRFSVKGSTLSWPVLQPHTTLRIGS